MGNSVLKCRRSKVKQIAAIYPFCAEILPVIKLFENLQKEYSLKYIISPKGFGYVEQDAAYACNHPQIGIKVLDEIPFDKDDWSTLLLFEPIMKKEISFLMRFCIRPYFMESKLLFLLLQNRSY